MVERCAFMWEINLEMGACSTVNHLFRTLRSPDLSFVYSILVVPMAQVGIHHPEIAQSGEPSPTSLSMHMGYGIPRLPIVFEKLRLFIQNYPYLTK